ncbi:phosphopentomutase [candidate division KSB3 bacterium]|uniref:Phosphopentomutase n=1 Tax=candidate division KSB3 bacterium TaxID=2044937 RepID=A0A9D5JVJ1_9BACT|nr:phosphopentomutase [candidate division KSB3 bacterium]MBD3324697.1 phosphopentomutase [candidate division KSB3 bacterium]
MPHITRVIVIVLDSVGIGALPDAAAYGDAGSHTLGNIAHALGGLALPHFQQLGLGHIAPLEGVPPVSAPAAAYGKMAERSAGKDTTTGHWELMGLVLEDPFPVYPEGFPDEIIDAFTHGIGKGVLGNKPASGTAIIEELGAEHLATGKPIVYTSADSVFQIAAHEEVIPVDQLYAMCEQARDILQGRHAVGRVIARPFVGEPGNFTRTSRRKDFSRKPPQPTVLDLAKDQGLTVTGVGKIDNIFADQGLTGGTHTTNDMAGVDATLEAMGSQEQGIILANLCDFDMLYGHRNNIEGYAQALRDVDARIPELLEVTQKTDLLVITADHGCDPTTTSTDHSREYVPLLVYSPALRGGTDLGVRETFADLGATIADVLHLPPPRWGTSFASELTVR